jgi:hypothetical protein
MEDDKIIHTDRLKPTQYLHYYSPTVISPSFIAILANKLNQHPNSTALIMCGESIHAEIVVNKFLVYGLYLNARIKTYQDESGSWVVYCYNG